MNDAGPRYFRLRRFADRTQSLSVALAALLSGLLLGCCFPPINATALAWVAIAPLGLVLTVNRVTSEGWAGVYLGGLSYHLIALHWISELEPHSSFFVIWLILSQLGALLFCISMLVARTAVARYRIPVCVGLPLFWIGFELLRIMVVSAIDPAAGPWLRLGGTQVEWSLVAQIAEFGGETTLGIFVALVNGWIFELVCLAIAWWRSDRVRWHAATLVAPIAVLAVVSYGWWRLGHCDPSPGPTVALLGREEWLIDDERRLDLNARSADAEFTQPELLIWPELADHHKFVTGQSATASPVPSDIRTLAQFNPVDYSAWYRNRLSQVAKHANAGIILGCERVDLSGDFPRRYNSVVYADSDRGFVGFGDKQHLAPLYEREAAVTSWFRIPTYCRYSPGTADQRFTINSRTGRKCFACIVCYDIAYRNRVAELGGDGSVDFFVHCGSEASDPSGVVSQTMLRMARLRAIETRRPIVRNCHGGASGVIDEAGRFTRCNPEDGHPARVTIPLHSQSRNPFPISATFVTFGAVSVVSVIFFPGLRLPRRARTPSEGSTMKAGHRRAMITAPNNSTTGFSLLELLATLAILGTLVALIVPRINSSSDNAKQRADELNRSVINSAVERYYLVEGVWPSNNLSDISVNPEYFPDGIPTNPVTGTPYRLNATTHRVLAAGGGGK